MPLSWKRKPQSKSTREEKRQERINQIAWKLYETRCSHDKHIDKDHIWLTAAKIANSPFRAALFTCHRLFIKLEKRIWEPILTWADNQALLSLLGVVGNVGLLIAVGMYIGSEKQRRDTEVLTAWQTLTNAHGQPGNGGRIKALEFLNASPRNKNYPGANWRRRASCLWICTWPSENLAGIDLSSDAIEIPELTAQEETSHEYQANKWLGKVYLGGAQLPGASLGSANLKEISLAGANLEEAHLVVANLEGTDLEGANLKGADLEGANLARTNLHFANFKGANLWYANLKGADFETTDFEKANLGGTNLKGNIIFNVNLTDANLTAANLEGATLRFTRLTGADLSHANLKGTNLGESTLEDVILCQTILPSDISVDPNRDCKELGLSSDTGEPE